MTPPHHLFFRPEPAVSDLIARGWRALRRDGLAATLLRAARAVGRSVYLEERHVWYRLDLARERPRVPLAAGLELIRASVNDLQFLVSLPTVRPSVARARHRAGADAWLVMAGLSAVFACWTFHRSTPMLAAPDGRLWLPPDTVGLEDTVTAPAYRGRGVARAAFSAIADRIASDGTRVILTKTEEDNVAARHALESAGFRELASMRLVRVGGRSHVEVRPGQADDLATMLVTRLAR